MHLIKENDVYKRESDKMFSRTETITFKQPETKVFEKADYDWYIIVALEKSDLVKVDRHLLTSELLLEYRWAIREAHNHLLDHAMVKEVSHPRNKNTVAGIKGYIEKIKLASDREMAEWHAG